MTKSRVCVSGRNSRIHQSLALIAGSRNAGRQGCVAMLVALVLLSLSSTGCSSFWGDGGWVDRTMQQHVARLHDRVWAKRAFHLRYGHCKRAHAGHFEEGFVAGYCDVCNGGNGQTPTLPPEKYWGFQYRTNEGSEMQTAWFAGFEAGVGSAKTDGGGSWRGVRFSRELREAMVEQRRQDELDRGISREYITEVQPGDGFADPAFPGPAMMPQNFGPAPLMSQPGINTPATVPGASPLLPAIPASSGVRGGMPLPSQIYPADMPVVPGAGRP